MRKSARLLIGIVAAAAPLAGALVSPMAAEAAPKRIVCKDNVCHESCTQQLPNGDTVYYDHGTRIVIVGADGNQDEFVCKDGKWERARTGGNPTGNGVQAVGNIGVGAIAGVRGDIVTDGCGDTREPACGIVRVGPPGLFARAR